jgi:hypothetical protein
MAIGKSTQILAAATVVACVALLAACQQDGMNAALSPNQGYSLHLVDEGDYAKLAYGQANSDDVGLMLECAKGSRNIEISDVARGSSGKLRLQSGQARSDFGGAIVPGPGANIVTATSAPDAPALRAFRDTGRIEVEHGGRRYGVTATPAEQVEVKRFFAMCEQA